MWRGFWYSRSSANAKVHIEKAAPRNQTLIAVVLVRKACELQSQHKQYRDLGRGEVVVGKYDAVDTTLGFGHQILSALVLLLGAEDDESVSIELSDDVTVHHVSDGTNKAIETRYQISHTLNSSPSGLTLKSVKLWKTLAIWAAEFSRDQRYLLLTCAPVAPDLSCLLADSDRTALQQLLLAEAALVISEFEANTHKHTDRLPGCRAFSQLSALDQMSLLRRITIIGNSSNITDTDQKLSGFFRNTMGPEKRPLLIARIREYWINRVFKSLTKELPRVIPKAEIQDFIEQMIPAITGTALPDDFGELDPTPDIETPNMMRRQIELVNGGRSRVARARVAHWRSRNQRDRWMADDITSRNVLDSFDRKLVEHWGARHGPMCDDTKDSNEEEKRKQGRDLLDWSHTGAPASLISLGSRTPPPFLIQGTYQDLADRLDIGWHPEYEVLLKGAKGSAPDKS